MVELSRRHKALPPRHKRLNRRGRLQAARVWMASYRGKNIVQGYRKHFGVDSLCAIRELRMLAVQINPDYEAAVLASAVQQRKRTEKQRLTQASAITEGDRWFAFIAGYIQGWAPDGMACEDVWPYGAAQFDSMDIESKYDGSHGRWDDEIPF